MLNSFDQAAAWHIRILLLVITELLNFEIQAIAGFYPQIWKVYMQRDKCYINVWSIENLCSLRKQVK